MHVSFVYFYSTPSSASPTKTYWRWTCWSFSCMVSFQVTWLKNGNKIFEYINGRNPPYRNFTIPGAVIDVRTWASSSSSYFWAFSSSFSCSCPIIACNPPPPPPPPLVSGTGSHHTWLCTFRVPSEQRRWWFCILVRPTQENIFTTNTASLCWLWRQHLEYIVTARTTSNWVLIRVDDEIWITSVGGCCTNSNFKQTQNSDSLNKTRNEPPPTATEEERQTKQAQHVWIN